jgi:hypothetical protein
VAKKVNSQSRQERANANARAWGFKNDYTYRKWAKQSGLTGLKGNHRIARTLDALNTPQQFSAARKSGKLAQGLAAKGARYYDVEKKRKVPLDKKRLDKYISDMIKRDPANAKYWRANKRGLRTVDDYVRLLMLAEADYGVSSRARVDALFYIMVIQNGLTAAQFKNAYRDALIEAGIDPSDFNDYVHEMMDEFIGGEDVGE